MSMGTDSLLPEADGRALSLLRTILGGLADGVVVQDAAGHYVYANERIARMSGYASPAEMTSAPPRHFLSRFELLDDHGRVLPLERLPGRRVFAGEDSPSEVVRFRDRITGEERWSLVSARRAEFEGHVLAISTVRDVTDARSSVRALEAGVRQQTAIARLGERALIGIDLEQLMQEAVELAARGLGAELCKLLTVIPGTDELLLRGSVGWPPDLIGHTRVPGGHRSVAGYTLLASGPVVVEDLEHDSRFEETEFLREQGAHSGVSVIMYGHDGPFGVLGVHTREYRHFSDDDVAFVQEVANVLSTALARQRAEAELRESEMRFRTLADSAPVMLWVTDAAGEVVFANRQWRDYIGTQLPAGIVPSEAWLRMVHPDERQAVERGVQDTLGTGASFRQEFRFRRHDGEYCWLLATGQPRVPVGAQSTGMVASAVDITERRRIEASQQFLLDASMLLHASRNYEATLVTVAQLAVPRIADWCAVDLLQEHGTLARLAVVHEDESKVQLARDLQRRYPADTTADRGVHHVLRTGEPQLITNVTDALLQEAARDDEHLALLRSIGFRSAMIVPLVAHERILGALTFVSAESGRRFDEHDLDVAADLARRAAAAIEIARLLRDVQDAHQELEMQAEELEQTLEELEAANEDLTRRGMEAESARADAVAANRAKSEFLAMMSHELRTPLNAIGGYTQLLEMGILSPLSEGQRFYVDRIWKSHRVLLALINDVLNFARLETGHVQFEAADVSVDAMLRTMDELIEPQLRDKQLSYRYHGGDPDVTVRADHEKARQIVLNLLTNAVKFTDPGGRIELAWEPDDEDVHIHVRDTGRGIPADKREAIFAPFVQVDRQVASDGSGVGLGLAISRDLARAMGGDLAVESEPGVGSTFTVTLPRRERAESDRGDVQPAG
ncbi:MAG TPA: ATP-binding protein [Gemmatimonadaceae bacterium]|nr:ATP-binding protein [Gemmatimonadaceae bacterium]